MSKLPVMYIVLWVASLCLNVATFDDVFCTCRAADSTFTAVSQLPSSNPLSAVDFSGVYVGENLSEDGILFTNYIY